VVNRLNLLFLTCVLLLPSITAGPSHLQCCQPTKCCQATKAGRAQSSSMDPAANLMLYKQATVVPNALRFALAKYQQFSL
jgi:hypothetical protein